MCWNKITWRVRVKDIIYWLRWRENLNGKIERKYWLWTVGGQIWRWHTIKCHCIINSHTLPTLFSPIKSLFSVYFDLYLALKPIFQFHCGYSSYDLTMPFSFTILKGLWQQYHESSWLAKLSIKFKVHFGMCMKKASYYISIKQTQFDRNVT